MSFVEDKNVVETLAAYRTDQTLGGSKMYGGQV
jgi:hypothetical protein